MPIPAITMADPRDHVRPIRVITMGRCAHLRDYDAAAERALAIYQERFAILCGDGDEPRDDGSPE